MRIARQKKVGMIVIDTLGLFDSKAISDKSGNDYITQIEGLQKYIKITDDLDCAIVFVHHEGRMSERSPNQSGLYATGLVGTAEQIILLTRDKEERFIESMGRIGEFDIPKSELKIVKNTGTVYVGEAVTTVQAKDLTKEIMEFAESENREVSHQEILDGVTGNRSKKIEAINYLVEQEKLNMTSENPKKYVVPVPDPMGGTENTTDTSIISQNAEEINDNIGEVQELSLIHI